MTLTNCTGLCGSDKVGYLKVRFRNSFSTVADPGTVFAGLELTTGNVALQAKSHDYPINIDAVGNLLNWLEINNETTLPDGISAIRSYQQLGGFNGFTLISVTGGNACMDEFSCDVSLGVDSFITTRSSMVNVAATALIADAPVRWQKFCTHVFNNASNLVEPVCGHGKFIEMD